MEGAYRRLLGMNRTKSGAATPAGVGSGTKAAGYTNYLNDANLCAAYLLNSTLVDASAATANDLTAGGTTEWNTSVYKEGTASLFINGDSPDYASIADAALSAGFPGKSSGGTGSYLSVGAWVRLANTGNTRVILSKWNEGGDQKSWKLLISSANRIMLALWDSSSYEVDYTDTTLTMSANVWYWLAAVWDTTGDAVTLYWATDGDGSVSNDGGTARTADFGLKTAVLQIGSEAGDVSGFSGLIDEAFVFKDALTGTEITEIYLHGLAGNR